jgi:hypothetical protein
MLQQTLGDVSLQELIGVLCGDVRPISALKKEALDDGDQFSDKLHPARIELATFSVLG